MSKLGISTLDWKDFRNSDVPMEDDDTGEQINEHELFCLWFLCQCFINDAEIEDDMETAEAIELASRMTLEAPEFGDMNFIQYCLDNLEEKSLVARTQMKSLVTYLN